MPLRRVFCGILALAMTISVQLPAARAAEIEVSEISDGLYLLTGVVCNAAFLVTDEGVLVVDTGNLPSHGSAILDEIAAVTDKPVKFVILTHYHGDHVNGLCSFPESAEIIGHRNFNMNISKFMEKRLTDYLGNRYPGYIRNLEEKVAGLEKEGSPDLEKEKEALETARSNFEDMKKVRVILAERIYDDELVIELGGETIRLVHPGPAHTSGNSIVHFVDRKTVHMGDMLFNRLHPYIDREAGSNTENWIRALKEVAGWDIETVIPGHGELTGKEGLHWKIRYLTDLRKEVAAAIGEGKTLEEAKESVKMSDYSEIGFPYMLAEGIEAVYREMSGE